GSEPGEVARPEPVARLAVPVRPVIEKRGGLERLDGAAQVVLDHDGRDAVRVAHASLDRDGRVRARDRGLVDDVPDDGPGVLRPGARLERLARAVLRAR